jgi:hypothetical protein
MTVLSKNPLKINIRSIEYDTVSALLIGFIFIITLSMRSLRAKSGVYNDTITLPLNVSYVKYVISNNGPALCRINGDYDGYTRPASTINIDYVARTYQVILVNPPDPCNPIFQLNLPAGVPVNYNSFLPDTVGQRAYVYVISTSSTTQEVLQKFGAVGFNLI